MVALQFCCETCDAGLGFGCTYRAWQDEEAELRRVSFGVGLLCELEE